MNTHPIHPTSQIAHKSLVHVLLLIAPAALSLASCGKGDNAPQAIEGYLQALVSSDSARLANLSCADWEAQARIDMDAFAGVAAHLEGLSCQAGEATEEATPVTCSGQIVASYNGEAQTFDLGVRTFVAEQEGGAWRMCGYK